MLYSQSSLVLLRSVAKDLMGFGLMAFWWFRLALFSKSGTSSFNYSKYHAQRVLLSIAKDLKLSITSILAWSPPSAPNNFQQRLFRGFKCRKVSRWFGPIYRLPHIPPDISTQFTTFAPWQKSRNQTLRNRLS
jgi:hypothetical protein